MTATLEELLQIEGVILAFEFKADGTCTDYKSHQNTGPEMATLISRYCALVTMSLTTLAGSFTAISEQNWIPQQGWTYTGGDYTVVIGGGGYRGVFAEKNRVDLNALVKTLAA
jgi:roadblock/LC7 domain-containing protein